LTQKKDIKRRLAAFCLTAFLSISLLSATVGAAEVRGFDFPSEAAPVHVTLDGETVLAEEAMILRSVTYVPLRHFAELIGADSIEWDAKNSTATVQKGSTQLAVRDGAYVIVASGRYLYTGERIENFNGRLFVPFRPLAKAFCVELAWDGATRTVILNSTDRVLESGASFYDSNDLYWLSRIISAEASGESLYGQIAVGNVVMNRVASRQYPNTVYGVIFDRVGGVQFSPVAMGTIYRAPTASAITAAKICLEGTSISDEILFFMNPRIATNNWISQNRPFAFRIGNHDFYK
jgi:N-acetylmuramoyl-L-alanine amidase